MFYKKHRALLRDLDARITDEAKLICATRDYLIRMHENVSEHITGDIYEDIAAGQADDTERILNEEDPYKAVLFVLDAIIAFKEEPEQQPGLVKVMKRFQF